MDIILDNSLLVKVIFLIEETRLYYNESDWKHLPFITCEMTEYILLLEVIMACHYFLQIEWCMLRMYEKETTRAGLSEGALHASLTIFEGSESLCKT